MDANAGDAGKAPFERIAGEIAGAIKTGRLAPGAKLAGQREIATEYGVAVATAQRALKHLQDEGWIVSRIGVGHFVSDSAGREPLSLQSVADQVSELSRALARLETRFDRLTEQRETD